MLERMMELFERLVVAQETIAKNGAGVNALGVKEPAADEGVFPLIKEFLEEQTVEEEAFPPTEELVVEKAEDVDDFLDPLTDVDFDDLANKKIVSLCEERGIQTTSPTTGRLRGYAPMKTALKKWREEFSPEPQEEVPPSDSPFQEGMIPVGPQTVVVDEETPTGGDVFGDSQEIGGAFTTPVPEIVSAEELLQKGIEAYHIAEKNLPGSGNALIAKYCQQYSGQPSLKSVSEEHRNAVYNALCNIQPGVV